jgi:Uma2 family endonuclease
MGAIAEQKSGMLSREQYLGFLATRSDKERWQLLDGTAVMMNPPTLVHQLIAMNLATELNIALRRSRPDLIALVELGVSVPSRPAFLPEVDLAVVDMAVDYSSYAGRFYLTAEILSESNTQEYMSLKLEGYAAHPDNLYSLVVAQREIRVDVHSRANGWQPSTLRKPDDILALQELGLHCRVGDIYRGTPLA